MSLRVRLRADTRAHHDRVDACFGAYDLSVRTGYAGFLAAHIIALKGLQTGIDQTDGPDVLHDTRGMLSDLGQDLARLDRPYPPAVAPRRAALYRSDAVRYVLLGSQIGLALLRRRWAASAEPGMRQVDAFLTRKIDPSRWTDLCRRLSICSARGVWADGVVADTQAIFELYASAATGEAMRRLGPAA